jgi:UPF0716 protein FxsA
VCGVLALLFLVIPATEIYVILKVGAFLGAGATLAVIAVTAIVGAALAKSQGVAVLKQMNDSINQGQGVGTAIVEGALVLAAGVTLLAPGFLTDAIGLLLLVPPVRSALAAHLAGKVQVITPMSGMPMDMPMGFQGPGFDADADEPPPGVIDV